MKKGFTLIELLAVIVILAVISLIAVPVVLNIIDDARINSYKLSASNYTKGVVTEIAAKNLTTDLNPSRCQINNGAVECLNSNGSIVPVDVHTNNSQITGGYIDIKDGEVVNYLLCIDDKYSVNMENEVNSNSKYCKNYNDPNAPRYTAKFYVNNVEHLTDKNYNALTGEYIGFLEGSNELILPDIPLDKSVLDTYSMPVRYTWRSGISGSSYYDNDSYTFINKNVNFYADISFTAPDGASWIHYEEISNGGKKNIKGSTLYSGIKNQFHLAPGTDDYAYHMAPFIDGTTYTFEELNTTYKNTEFYAYTFYTGVDLDRVIGTGIKVYVGDYDNPTSVLADEYYDIDPNSNDDFITTEITTGLGAIRPAKTIQECFGSDPYRDTYDAARVIRLIIPYDDYKGLDLRFEITHKDINGGYYRWSIITESF